MAYSIWKSRYEHGYSQQVLAEQSGNKVMPTKNPVKKLEKKRLAALHRYKILDTGPEDIFDDLTQLASYICNTPIALISFVDEDRQWFKSRYGLKAQETSRSVSFCSHAIRGKKIFEVNAPETDIRFLKNPLVTGQPKIRFYAGMPLSSSDGHNVGTICVIDKKHRQLSQKQREGLERLARQVITQLESRLSREKLRIELAARRRAEQKLKRAGSLLSAVSELQSNYICNKKSEPAEFFNALLELILSFTASEYGFVAEVLHDPDGQPYLKTHAITNISWNKEMRVFYEKHKSTGLEFRNLNTLFGAALTSEETVISNSPGTDPRRGGLPPGHPPMNSFLGVPIKNDGKIIALVGVSNRKKGYNQKLVDEMEPLLSTYSTIIRGYQLAKQQEVYRDEITALNKDLKAHSDELTITVEKLNKSHDELRATQLQLIQAAKTESVVTLAAGVAHEVKNPLQTILMTLDYIETVLTGNDPIINLAMKDMRDAVGRANKVCQDLMHFSAPADFIMKSEDLNDLVQHSLLFLKNRLIKEKIRVEQKFGKLPPVVMDRDKIEQVLINLFINAIQAMSAGGLLTVNTFIGRFGKDFKQNSGNLHQFKPGQYVAVIEVQDTGMGIPKENLTRIFDPFFTTKPVGASNGLGLSVAKKIIELHRGVIEINNAPKGGALAKLIFPVYNKTHTVP